MFNKILLTSALLAVPIYMSAANDDDDDTSRRWAVIAGMNISSPTTASHEQSQSYVEKAGAFGSPMGNLMLEYYLSNDHFSLVGGYNAETLEWFSSDVSATMRNISVGVRYYPLRSSCAIQPYASLMTYTNVGSRHEQHNMSCTGETHSYERNYDISYPRLSVAPTVGLDCYILSSLALEFQYGFPLAFDGKTRVISTYSGQPTAYQMHSNMHRHNIQIGVKATFPFCFTSDDGNSIYKFLCKALGLYYSDDEPNRETKKERHKSNLTKVLNSY